MFLIMKKLIILLVILSLTYNIPFNAEYIRNLRFFLAGRRCLSLQSGAYVLRRVRDGNMSHFETTIDEANLVNLVSEEFAINEKRAIVSEVLWQLQKRFPDLSTDELEGYATRILSDTKKLTLRRFIINRLKEARNHGIFSFNMLIFMAESLREYNEALGYVPDILSPSIYLKSHWENDVFREVINHELTHFLRIMKLIENDITANSYGFLRFIELRGIEELEYRFPEEYKFFKAGIDLMKRDDLTPEKRVEIAKDEAKKMASDLNEKLRRNKKDKKSLELEPWERRIFSIMLGGMAWEFAQQTGDHENIFRYLNLISEGMPFAETEKIIRE